MPDIFNSSGDTKEQVAQKSSSQRHFKKNRMSSNRKNRKKRIDSVLSQTLGQKLISGEVHPLSSFCYYPARVKFINEDPEEEIILLLRRHPITNLGWILIAILMVLAPLLFKFYPVFDFLPSGFQIVSVMIWYMITVAFIFEEFLSWFFHVNIITDERIIEVDFVNLLYREMTDANIDQIQDVTVKMGGAPRTFFNYGNLIIQTASEVPRIDFEAVPNPDEVARVLRELRVEEEREKLEGRVR